ncbi:MAG: Gfo/Idh/MocA family protein, partial [Verrucomicrobiia bacterium]
VGQITASLVHHGEEQQIVFQGEHARVGIPWRVCASRQRDNGFPEENVRLAAEIQALHDSVPPLEFEGHDGQVSNMLAAIEGGERLLIDGLEGRRPIELITAIYQSAHLGVKVEIPLPGSAPFYTREGILKNAHRFHQKTRSVESFSDNRITFGRDYGA